MKPSPTEPLGRFLLRLLCDERRGEFLEYAAIATAISLLAVALVAALRLVEAPIPVE